MSENLTPNIFDWHAAQIARDAAIEQVGANASVWWMDNALAAIRQCARALPEFTTDDVWRVLGQSEGMENRAMGAAMRKAAQDGIITPTDRYRNSEQVSCHGRPKRLWRRNLT